MLWNWFTKKPPSGVTGKNGSRTLADVVGYLNEKYGEFEYAKDARALDVRGNFVHLFKELISRARSAGSIQSVLVAGANNGIELNFLPGFDVTALDLSDVALNCLRKLYPDVRAVQGDIEHLPFSDKEFDMYICMRSVHASNLDILKALDESLRVTRSFLIYSVSNGYNIEGKLVKGMYDYEKGEIDVELPRTKADDILRFLEQRNCVSEVFEVPSEIMIFSEVKE